MRFSSSVWHCRQQGLEHEDAARSWTRKLQVRGRKLYVFKDGCFKRVLLQHVKVHEALEADSSSEDEEPQAKVMKKEPAVVDAVEHGVVDAVEHISDDSDEEHRSDDSDEEDRSDDSDEDAARAAPSELEVKPEKPDVKTEKEDDLKACGFALVDSFLNLFVVVFLLSRGSA